MNENTYEEVDIDRRANRVFVVSAAGVKPIEARATIDIRPLEWAVRKIKRISPSTFATLLDEASGLRDEFVECEIELRSTMGTGESITTVKPSKMLADVAAALGAREFDADGAEGGFQGSVSSGGLNPIGDRATGAVKAPTSGDARGLSDEDAGS